MLAQLVTDEAKPGSGEKWSVDCFPLSLENFLIATSAIFRLRTYTFVVYSNRGLYAKLTWRQGQALRARD